MEVELGRDPYRKSPSARPAAGGRTPLRTPRATASTRPSLLAQLFVGAILFAAIFVALSFLTVRDLHAASSRAALGAFVDF